MSEPIQGTTKRPSTSDEVFGKLSRWIERGDLRVGSLLPAERQLAAQLGVSRVVIREATRELELRGMVSIRQGIGVRVINNPSRPIQDAFYLSVPEKRQRLRQCAQARLLIEPELAALAAQKSRPDTLHRLRDSQNRLLDATNSKLAAVHDIAFHEVIAETAENTVLALMLASIAELGRISREYTLEKFGFRHAYDFHETILEAIANHDEKSARKAMKIHLSAALGDLPEA